MTTAGALDLWEAGLTMTPAARAVLLLHAAGEPDAADWPVGRRDAELLRHYCGTAPLSAVTDCRGCGAALDVAVLPADLAAPGAPPQHVTVELGGYRVVARVPTAGDLERLPSGAPGGKMRQILLERCVVEAEHDGAAVGARDLPATVVDAVETSLEDADPGSDVRLELRCAECGAGWTESLDPVRFAWFAVEAAARRLATDVHTLAHAYGWSEREILALSPFRRHLYLSAVEP